ncbi:hypothetical protein Aco04nite_84800 [Winogradskya consettensis]|uniref:DUF11 domain-containing protein n=1 Tax=Winogradskya consettensis TaxID=113560 RepID=A0A919VWR0_9ACTN|nr:hypothetical protein Aco04nite_84800 [Actinoplanes consettensis]
MAGTVAAVASATLAAPAFADSDSVLLAGASQQLSAELGGDFDVTLSVTNKGTTALDGVGVALNTGWAFETTDEFSNCDYFEGAARLCTFGETLEPGKSYRVVLPYKVRADTRAPVGLNGQFSWLTAAEVVGRDRGAAGVGGTLELQEGDKLGESTSGSFQAVDVDVSGTNGVDLVAIGDTVSGAVGDEVQATVGVRNAGPASLDGSGLSLAEVVVAIPAGTSFVSAKDCEQDEDVSHYVCAAPSLFKAGETATWTFTLKVDKVVADAQGTVRVNPPCQCKPLADLDASNNAALLAANPSTGDGTDRSKPVVVDTGLLAGQWAPAELSFAPGTADNVGVTEVGATVNGSLKVDCTLAGGCKVSTKSLKNDTDATVVVRATDAAGNFAEKSVKVHVDNVLPTAGFSPAAGSPVQSGPVPITLTGVSDDAWRVDVIDGGVRSQLMEDPPRSYTWNATSGATSPQFVLFDFAGNTTTLATNYVVDDQAPVIARVDFGGSYSTNRLDTGAGWVGGVSTLKPTVQDGSKIARAEWKVNGAVKSSSQTFSWDARSLGASATVQLQVWDVAGNTSSKSFKVNIDKAGPTMTVAPSQNKLIRGTTYVTSVKASDAHGVAVTNLKSKSGSVTSVRVSSGKDGVKAITWVGVDKLGNSASVTRTLIVDNTAPTVKVTKAPKNKSKLTKKVTFAASASDRNGVAKVQLLVNGKVVGTDAKAGYSFVLNPKKYGKTFTVQLRAYDKAGNLRNSAKLTYHR